MHNTIYGFVDFLAAAETAHLPRVHHSEVLPDASNARDHPSIILIHPAHAGHLAELPAWPRLSFGLLWLCAGLCTCRWQRSELQCSLSSTSWPTRLAGLVELASGVDSELFLRLVGTL